MKKINVTTIILLINTFLFFFLLSNSARFQEWGLIPQRILEGEYYRLLTSAFLYGNLIHLLMNMYGLFMLGNVMETLTGSRNFLLIYLCALIGGALSSFVVHMSIENFVSVGASGAIYGLFGSLLTINHHFKKYNVKLLDNNGIIINILLLGCMFFIPGLDNAAHVGGLLMGALYTYFLLREDASIKKQMEAVATRFHNR